MKDAPAQMEALLAQVEDGQEVNLTSEGKPVAKLVKYKGEPRRPGSLKGQIWMAPDFDEVDSEIARLFNESEIFPPEEPEA